MDYLEQITNSYYYKVKEHLEPVFEGEAKIEEGHGDVIAYIVHSFGKIAVKLKDASTLKFEKYGTFETWEEGVELAKRILKQLAAFKKMSMENMPKIEEKWHVVNSELAEIWNRAPGEGMIYNEPVKGENVNTLEAKWTCQHTAGSYVVVTNELTKSKNIYTIQVKIETRPASGWLEDMTFVGKSNSRHTRRLDGFLSLLKLSGKPGIDIDSLNLPINTGGATLAAYVFGIAQEQTARKIGQLIAPPSHTRHNQQTQVLNALDPDRNQKIHTDYGIAGYVFQNTPDGRNLVVQLFDLPIRFVKSLRWDEELDQKDLLRQINDSFEKQFLKFRSRGPHKVDPQRGRFESLEKKLSSVFIINEHLNVLRKLSEGIGDDIYEHIKSVLKKILDSEEINVEIEPGKKLPRFNLLAKLKKPGSAFWIIMRGSQVYVKPGGFAGTETFISSDRDLKEQISEWYHSDSARKIVRKPQAPSARPWARPPATSPERFPNQEKYKDIEKSEFFPRTVYHRQGAVPGGRQAPNTTPFMLSIHAPESMIDFTWTGEKGKIPAGLFTGLDLHAVSSSGIRPGHLGWIGGYYYPDASVMYITEVQSDLMQRTWDLLDRSKRDVDTAVGKGKKKQAVRSQKHRIRELASQLKQARVELAQMQQREYGNVADKYRTIERIQELNSQLNSAKNRYKQFTRLPMFSNYKSQIENLFKSWIKAFYADAFNFARDKDLKVISIASTDNIASMHHNVNVGQDRESSIYHRLYDKIAMELGATKSTDGKWWVIPLEEIPTTESFEKRIDKLLNEAVYGNKATVFHKTPNPEKILSIAKWGFFPSLRGAHGQGLYAVFDPDKMKKNWLNTRSYGDFVIKMAVNLEDKILILDYPTAKKFYGDKYRVADQLDQMGVNWRRQEMTEFDPWELHKKVDYTDVEFVVQQLDNQLENGTNPPPNLVTYSALRYDINGIFFVGPHGYELVGFDTSIYKPLSFSKITGKESSINELEWHKFNREGIDYIYQGNENKLPPKSHWHRQL